MWFIKFGTASNSTEWSYLDLTSIMYPNGDVIGKFLALSSQFPIWIVVVLLAFITYGKKKYRRRLSLILVGLFINEAINLIIKNYIQQPRPYVKGRIIKSYGMPSSHSQFMSFFFINSLLLIRKSSRNILLKLMDLFILFMSLILVCISRVYLMYHTYRQVYLGVTIGILNGIVWILTNSILLTFLRYTFEGSFKKKTSEYW